MGKDTKLKLLFLFLLLFWAGASFVYALEINYPRLPGAIPPQDFLTSAVPEDILPLYVKYLVNLSIWVAGILALAGLIYGGIKYLLSTGKVEAMVSARDQITAAFFGLLLLLSSYLILNILSPEFTILKISPLKEIEPIEKRYVAPPSTSSVYSSIDIELPFGRIIERIFETYISDLPDSVVRTPRIERIKENILKTLEIAEKLKENGEKLKNYSYDCTCYETKPITPCGGIRAGDTTWKCDSGGCGATGPVTSDPCKKVRNEIEKLEQDNLKQITLLKEEQQKTLDEISDLKIELNQLERLESFIKYCPDIFKNSYAQFLDLKKSYESGGGIVREIPFWDDIIIPYMNKEGKIVPGWATFLCTIGGNILPTTRSLFEEEQKMEEIVVKEKPKACSNEIPVGEIIDRTKRTTSLLITKLEKLVGLDKEIIDAVDALQVLVSQCSSQRGCERRCTNFRCGCDTDPCIDRCQGWAYGCADSSSKYPGECKERDEDTPCPYKEISEQLEKIQEIEEKIEKVINDPLDKIEKEKSGILILIDSNNPDSVVSRILKELDKIQILTAGTRGIRYPLQICGVGQSEEILLACQQARGDIDPEGRKINQCCLEELVFQECLEKCYLEEGIEKYKVCLQNCLNEKAKEAEKAGIPRPEEISQCRHLINFFCCVK